MNWQVDSLSSTIFANDGFNWSSAQRSFPGTAAEVAFLLGGIGTGNVSLGARGEFRDWEIFNKPGKGVNIYHTFFSIWAKEAGKVPVCKVLESKLNPPFSKSHGFHSGEAAGLPRFKESRLYGEYPFVRIELNDPTMPVQVALEAYTPMVPLNPDDSGIPCAILRYKVKNMTSAKVDVTVAGSLLNAVGFDGYGPFDHIKTEYFGGDFNEYRQGRDFSGLFMSSNRIPQTDVRFGSLALTTPAQNITYKTYWNDEAWCDGIHDMWGDLCEDGRFEEHYSQAFLTSSRPRTGSLGIYDSLESNQEKVFPFFLTWHFPNRINGWDQSYACSSCGCNVTRNYYALTFKDAWDIAKYVQENIGRLDDQSF
jgi:uncharacterized protein (DUF608 family)